jgi:hypothetical protein
MPMQAFHICIIVERSHELPFEIWPTLVKLPIFERRDWLVKAVLDNVHRFAR